MTTITTPDIEIVEETIVDDYERPECFWHDCSEPSTIQALLSCAHTHGYCDPHAAKTQERLRSPSWVMHCTICNTARVEVVAWI